MTVSRWCRRVGGLGALSALAYGVCAAPAAYADSGPSGTSSAATTQSGRATGASATGASKTSATGASKAATAADARIQKAVTAAAAQASARGFLSGIAVVDRATGRTYTAGRATSYFPTESTVKVMLAANLLAEGKMTGQTARSATAMIRSSDDAAANRLYYSAGGDGVMGWAAVRYGIANLGAAPTKGSGWWGSTQVTPLGFAKFLNAANRDPQVGPWLSATMRGITDTASDGTSQNFGLRAADRTAAVKQGWGRDANGGDATMTPSVGWVGGGDRWSVAVFTGSVPKTSYGASMAASTASAKTLVAALG